MMCWLSKVRGAIVVEIGGNLKVVLERDSSNY